MDGHRGGPTRRGGGIHDCPVVRDGMPARLVCSFLLEEISFLQVTEGRDNRPNTLGVAAISGGGQNAEERCSRPMHRDVDQVHGRGGGRAALPSCSLRGPQAKLARQRTSERYDGAGRSGTSDRQGGV
jgi:hypothetical protein